MRQDAPISHPSKIGKRRPRMLPETSNNQRETDRHPRGDGDGSRRDYFFS